jgi:signal transduction histidine kinase
LAEHRTLSAVPRAELEWLAAHGSLRTLETGEVLSVKGHQVEALHIILSGRLALFIDRGAGPNKVIEWHAGDISGMLPYSRLTTAPGDSLALEPLQVLAIPRQHFRALTQECFEVTSILVHAMIDRTRLFTSSDLQNEKMISLGKLSAGLAHELNNPASAIERCAALLEDRIEDVEQITRALAAATLSDAQAATIDAVRASCTTKQKKSRSPLEQLDREESIAEWLAGHGLHTVCAGALADTEVTLESLDRLAEAMQPPTLDAMLRWLAAGCAVRSLALKIQDCSMRISSLVTAVKGFTHMDQANVSEPVHLGPGLENSVAVLNSKACEKSVTVALNLEPDLPRACGFAGELTQIWGILLDNALDAVADNGHVEIIAARENQNVIVRIIDDGAGIPAEHRDRIFDPFFTTKPLGHGTGLGLDIVRRLVRHNDGTINFESRPGRTEFRVSLPMANNPS